MAANSGFSGGAAGDLGLGGLLTEQVAGETEEQRKKRMLQAGVSNAIGPDASLAVQTIFGGAGKRAGF